MRTAIQYIFIVLFLALLVLPGAEMCFHFAPKVEMSENRNLATMPSLPTKWSRIAPYFAGVEAYVKDHLGFRPFLIRAHAIFKVKALAQSPSNKVIIGKNEWLFFSGSQGELLEYEKPFSDEELRTLKNALEIRKKWFSRNGTLFFFIVAPDKQTIYPEYLPEPQASWAKSQSRYDQMYRYCRANLASDVLDVLIDVKSEILREKERGRLLYYKTDSHWNQHGSWIAYRRIIESIAKYRPEVVGLKRENLLWKPAIFSGDLARMIGYNGLYQEEADVILPRLLQKWTWTSQEIANRFHGAMLSHPIITSKSPRALPMKVVVIRDSQFNAILPLFSETFGKGVYISWLESMESINKIIEAEKPDIIIQESVERFMPRALVRDLAKIDCSQSTAKRRTDRDGNRVE